jgi:hypothetical protein
MKPGCRNNNLTRNQLGGAVLVALSATFLFQPSFSFTGSMSIQRLSSSSAISVKILLPLKSMETQEEESTFSRKEQDWKIFFLCCGLD